MNHAVFRTTMWVHYHHVLKTSSLAGQKSIFCFHQPAVPTLFQTADPHASKHGGMSETAQDRESTAAPSTISDLFLPIISAPEQRSEGHNCVVSERPDIQASIWNPTSKLLPSSSVCWQSMMEPCGVWTSSLNNLLVSHFCISFFSL